MDWAKYRQETAEELKNLESMKLWDEASCVYHMKEKANLLQKAKAIAETLTDPKDRATEIERVNKALVLIDHHQDPFTTTCAAGCVHCMIICREGALGECDVLGQRLGLNDSHNGCLDYWESDWK